MSIFKKIFLWFLSLTVLFFVSMPAVNAMTEAERQALIQSISQQIILLQAQVAQMLSQQTAATTTAIATPTLTNTTGWCHTFNFNLGYSDIWNAEVGYLHTALQLQGLSYAPDLGNIYVQGTATAVAKFQEKYASEVLTPFRLTKGTGYFGTKTRQKMNQLYGCVSSNPVEKSQSVPVTPSTLNASDTFSIGVTSPNGGESWVQGSTYNITWNSTGLGASTATIYLADATSLARNYLTTTPVSVSLGTFSWAIPNSWDAPTDPYGPSPITTGSNYKIFIVGTAPSGETFSASSTNIFSIVASGVIPTCTSFNYSSWSSCVNGIKTRQAAGMPTGCTGGNPLLSVTCDACTSFTYSDWTPSVCPSSWIQTRTVLSSLPNGCQEIIEKPVLSRTCPICTVFTYSAWGACVNGNQTRTILSSLPAGCVAGSPVLSKACTTADPTFVSPPCASLRYRGDGGSGGIYDGGWYDCIDGVAHRDFEAAFPLGCTLVTEPLLTQSCTPIIYGGTCAGNGFVYGPWTTCFHNNQFRSVISASPPGCSNFMYALADAQSYYATTPKYGAPPTCPPTPNGMPGTPVKCSSYTYSDWSTCSYGFQTRAILSQLPAGCIDLYSEVIRDCRCKTFTYSAFTPSVCPASGLKTRTVLSASPAGCSTAGSPLALTTTCSVCNKFFYTEWGDCINGTQTREIWRREPQGCEGGTPDPISRACTLCTSFTYSEWSQCSAMGSQTGGTQTRDVLSYLPAGCMVNPSGIGGAQPWVIKSCSGDPSITNVISPTGGDSWAQESTHDITWTSNLVDGVVIYVIDSGGQNCTTPGSCLYRISTAAGSLGVYHWKIGIDQYGTHRDFRPGLHYRVRICSTANSSLCKDSGEFAITSENPGSITVTSPNGGQQWIKGQPKDITWTSSNVTNVGIQVLDFKGISYYNPNPRICNIAKVPSTAGFYQWNVGSCPESGGTDYGDMFKVRIYDTSYPPYNNYEAAVSDSSDNYFSIIQSPNNACIDSDGGKNYNTKGTTTGFYLSGTGSATDSCVTKTDGAYVHEYFCQADGVTIGWEDHICINGCTNGACVQTTNPNPCTSFTYSDWSTCSGGTQTRTVLTSLPTGCTGGNPIISQACCLPNWQCGSWGTCSNGWQYKSCTDSNYCGVTTGKPATSQTCTIAPSFITLTSPNGGEAWHVGQTYNITWNASADISKITLSITDMTGCNPLGGGVCLGSTIINGNITTGTSGSYSWTIPSSFKLGTNYQISINNFYGGAGSDASDNYFSIGAAIPNSIAVTSPSAGATLNPGETHNITWQQMGYNGYAANIYLTNSTGQVILSNIASNVQASLGSYSWAIPANTPAGQYKVYLNSNGFSVKSDTFNIAAVEGGESAITVVYPNYGGSFYQFSSMVIKWDYNTALPYDDMISIDVVDDTAGTTYNIANNVPVTWRQYNWTIEPQFLGHNCKIKITDNNDPSQQDFSDNYFTIQ